MKAMVVPELGEPEVMQMRDWPTPEPGEHDLLVEVHATSVNPKDCHMRRHGLGKRLTLPFVLGYDVSGVVKAVGPKVEQFRVGDEVYASPSLVRPGANAELVLVDERTAALKPTNLDHVHAAAMPLVTITAWESLHHRAHLHSGETVLIHAGAGGVGHIAIQLAKLHECQVITTASRDESIEQCTQLGADAVINYANENVVDRVTELTGGRGCPVVLDAVGGEVFNESMRCLAPHGRLVTLLPPPADAPIHKLFSRGATLALEFMSAATLHKTRLSAQGEVLRTVTELVEAERLKVHVSHVFPLEALAEAHRQQETRHTVGKIAVTVK
ncbi:zinc-binding alcohol dehydrogenase family protein [Phycisphaerales bacterium AB-hyl4]|uniref:Zinc-binding alcohol dehydrogenase family protein n=1 Tax=Natronomicrosphaera hydrolytica TaxID=3242702 RepID=A0ABV4U3R9_9BACT